MNLYYLMAQLPSLDALAETAPLPITEERFDQLCSQHMGKKVLKALDQLTLLPEREEHRTGNGLLDAWLREERFLRLALGTVRAGKMKKAFDAGDQIFSSQLLQVARTAVDMGDPMAAELVLQQYRLGVLEGLRPMDAFSEDALFYYALKLRLLTRIRRFDAVRGEAAYRSIYDSILTKDSQESET